jgi:hypothetical protein
MKKARLIFILLILTTALSGQEIKISLAPTINNAFYFIQVDGGPGHDFKPGFSTSLDFLFLNRKKINIGFGFCYQFMQVEYTPNMNTGDFTGQTDNINILSINVAAIYNLKHDYYISLNPLMNLQLKYTSDLITDKQNGLGLSFSIGKYFSLKDNIRLNIEPKININNIAPFGTEDYLKLRMVSAGLNIGLVFGKTKTIELREK